jgi:hypothetical protein
MNSGKISENTGSTGGVLMTTAEPTFTFSGGSITGNTGPRGNDLWFNTSSSHATPLILTGNGSVSSITLTNITGSNFIFIASSWTGEVATLNLCYADVSFPTVATQWAGKKVIQAASGYTLVTADIGKFKQVNFMNSNNLTRPISEEGRVISRAVADIGTLK